MIKKETIDFNVFGHVAWLWSCSPLHRPWPVSLIAINVIPAILTNQYVLMIENGFPVAYCSWANLSLENEVKYIKDTNALMADDWCSGERKWFIDWIAPFGHTNKLYKYMRKSFPNELFRSIHVTEGERVSKISEFQGAKIDRLVAKKQFLQYHHELISELKENGSIITKP